VTSYHLHNEGGAASWRYRRHLPISTRATRPPSLRRSARVSSRSALGPSGSRNIAQAAFIGTPEEEVEARPWEVTAARDDTYAAGRETDRKVRGQVVTSLSSGPVTATTFIEFLLARKVRGGRAAR
jgi:hypothetical protein